MTKKMINNKRINYAGKIFFLTFSFSLIYVVIRYHIAGGVPWKDFPFFILNKAISLTSFLLLTIVFSLNPLNNLGVKISEKWQNSKSTLGMVSFILVLIHLLMSLMLFNPSNYPNFFEPDGTLTLFSGISMLAGILAFVVIWIINLSFKTYLKESKEFITFITSRKFLLIALVLGGVHLFFMGYNGWLTPELWQAGIPPVSLITFIVFVIGYSINIIGRK